MAGSESFGWRRWLAVSSIYCLAVIALSPPLIYFQDEWSLLQSRTEFFGGIFVSHMGHFFPLGKLVFNLEAWVFATQYGGFIFLNSVVHVLNVLLIDRWLTRYLRSQHQLILRFSVALIYLTAVGTTFSIQFGMQIAWHLSVHFVLLLLHVLSSQQRLTAPAILLIVVAGFTFPSSTLLLLLLVSALIVGSYLHSTKHALVLVVSALLAGLGNGALANLWLPADVNARGWPLEIRQVIQQWPDAVAWASSVSLTWLIAPLSIIGPSDRSYTSRLGEYLREHSTASLIVWIAVISLVLIAFRSSTESHWARLRSLLVLVVLVVASTISVAFRFTNTRDFLTIRYAPVWLLISVIFWGVLVAQVAQRPTIRPVAWVIIGLMASTAVVGAVRFPTTLQIASEKSRVEQTAPQMQQLRNCFSTEPIVVYQAIQVSLTPDEMCAIAAGVRGLVPSRAK